jgi:hypothetical protein
LTSIPDQSLFAPLPTLRLGGQAVARLYAAPIPGLEVIASHPWFVIQSAGSDTLTRWEVWPAAGGPHGHVRKNLFTPEEDIGAGGQYIIAELTGQSAQPVVDFIESQSPTYPCKDHYMLLGPNSSTYAQWVLDNTGWNVTLPCAAVGKDAPPDCP